MFQAPNYTQIPNNFFDEMIPTLKEGQLRVLLVIMRQTFGWHKPWDRISLGQLSEKTGMEKKSVCRSVNSLIILGLLKKVKYGKRGEEQVFYHLVVENNEKTDENRENSNNLDQCPKDTPPSVLKTPTKETITKERKESNKERPPAPKGGATLFSEEAKQLVQLVQKKLKQQNPKAIELTPVQLSRDRKAAERLLITLTPSYSASTPSLSAGFEIAKEVIERAFSDNFWQNLITNMAYVVKKWNQLSAIHPKLDPIEENRRYAEKLVKKNPKLEADGTFELGPTYFELQSKGAFWSIDYKEKGCIEQIENQLRKWKVDYVR